MAGQFEKKVWRRIKFNFALTPFIRSHPYVWKDETKSVEPIPMNSTGFLHWCLNLTLAFLYCAFVQFRSVQLFLDARSSTLECLLTQLMAIYHMTVAIMSPAYLLQHDEVARFANTHIRFLQVTCNSYKFNLDEIKKLYGPFGTILGIFQTCIWMNQCFLVTIALARPWSPELVSSLMPNASQLAWGWRITFGILHAYLLATIAESFIMLFGFLAFLVLTSSGLLITLR